MIAPFAGIVPPPGWLICDGTPIPRSTYADLFAVIGEMYGPGDGLTTFNLPDLRGEFLRGVDAGRGADPDASSRTDRGDGTTGDTIGTKQNDQYRSHFHALFLGGGSSGPRNYISVDTYNDGHSYIGSNGEATESSGGNETRPRNVAFNFIIKT